MSIVHTKPFDRSRILFIMDKVKIWSLLLVLLACLSDSTSRPTPTNVWTTIQLNDLIAEAAEDNFASQQPLKTMDALDVGIQPSEASILWAQQRKRGFSMLARWKPFNTFGQQRTSVRNMNRAPVPINEYDLLSTETRALLRHQGQPLRWG